MPRRDRFRTVNASLRTLWAALRRLRWPLSLLLLVLAIGTALFAFTRHQPSLVHAFVYTLNLVTLQIGPLDLPADLAQQLASLGLMVGGLLALAGGAANLIEYIRDPAQQQMALASTFSNHVIVCGVGRIGYRVITELRELGDSVVAVNKTENEEWMSVLRAAGVPVIIGDARTRDTLIAAGIERASSLVSCTSDDLTNLDVALDARELNPQVKIVLRMFDQKLAEKVARGFNIQTAFSVSELAAPALAAAATRTRVKYSFKLDGQLLNVVTVTFDAASPFLGMRIQQVEEMSNCSLLALDTPAGMNRRPPHTHVFRLGDRAHFIGPLEGVRRLTP